jgi:hypothetical protein
VRPDRHVDLLCDERTGALVELRPGARVGGWTLAVAVVGGETQVVARDDDGQERGRWALAGERLALGDTGWTWVRAELLALFAGGPGQEA